MTVTKGQIKAIHTIKSKIGLCDEYYRCMLSQYGVESSKDLTFEQAEGLWATLQQMAKEAGIGKRKIAKGSNRWRRKKRCQSCANECNRMTRRLLAGWQRGAFHV